MNVQKSTDNNNNSDDDDSKHGTKPADVTRFFVFKICDVKLLLLKVVSQWDATARD